METLNPFPSQRKLLKIKERDDYAFYVIISFSIGGVMDEINFKTRVKNVAISESANYKKVYVDYEYLICSDAFVDKKYYVVTAKEDNYQHLIGINSLIKPKEFFNKCYNGTLTEDDFNFSKRGQNEKSVKGSVRRKISSISNIMSLFYDAKTLVEEPFYKNGVRCSFATSDNKCTLGFNGESKTYPKSLMKGNHLNGFSYKKISLVLRKKPTEEKFDEFVIGTMESLAKNYNNIEELIGDEIKEIYANTVAYDQVASDKKLQ